MMTRKRFLTAEWKYLAMLNYDIEPSWLMRYVPSGTELDSWNGRTFISVVGFLFLRTKVLGVPIPFHRNFEEVNLRFYVRRRAGDGWRRGVVFIKEIVPRWAIAAVARAVYNENYVAMRMGHRVHLDPESGGSVEYGWLHNGEWNNIALETRGAPVVPASGSEEEFITEHYWGYAAQSGGGCVEYQVEHPPWRVWQAADAQLRCNVGHVYGPEFAHALNDKPSSAFLAEGSPVVVYKGVRL